VHPTTPKPENLTTPEKEVRGEQGGGGGVEGGDEENILLLLATSSSRESHRPSIPPREARSSMSFHCVSEAHLEKVECKNTVGGKCNMPRSDFFQFFVVKLKKHQNPLHHGK
jgi:hypothetical protein